MKQGEVLTQSMALQAKLKGGVRWSCVQCPDSLVMKEVLVRNDAQGQVSWLVCPAGVCGILMGGREGGRVSCLRREWR